VCQIPPPYVWTPTSRYPAFSFFETGLTWRQRREKRLNISGIDRGVFWGRLCSLMNRIQTFKHGESVWAPIMEKPLPDLYLSPTAKATTELPLRVK
jgi:hypothetical protein